MGTGAEHSTSPAATVQSISEDASASLEKTPIQPSSPASSLFQKPKNEVEFNPGRRFYLAVAMPAVLTLMVALDGTSISVSLPIIAQKLNGTAIEAFWAGTSFLLTSTVFQPNYASFSHIFGRKPNGLCGRHILPRRRPLHSTYFCAMFPNLALQAHISTTPNPARTDLAPLTNSPGGVASIQPSSQDVTA